MNAEVVLQSGRWDRRLRQVAWVAWVFCVALGVAGLVLLQVNLPNLGPITLPGPYNALALAIVYGTVGLLIVNYRPGHGMGWLFMVLALLAAVSLITQQYTLFSVFTIEGQLLPGTVIAAWMSVWVQYLYFPAGIALPYLLFPDGRLPSRRWRPVAWLAVALVILITLHQMTQPGPIYFYLTNEAMRLPFSNPVGVELGRLRVILENTWVLALVVLTASIYAPIARFRRAKGTEREQLKWFVYFGVLVLLMFPLAFVAGEVAGNIFFAMTILILPVATAIAILRYHLYDIDVIIRKTLVYGLLSGVLALVYFGLVVGLQALAGRLTGVEDSPVVIVISTLFIAALFTPLRRKVQEVIDRRFFRQKYNAEQVLARFGRTARDEVDLEALTAELVAVVEETMRPENVNIWLKPDQKWGRPRSGKMP